MSKKGIRMRYAKLITLFSIVKGTVHMNENSLKKWEMLVVRLDF